jgi:hypothetical protein
LLPIKQFLGEPRQAAELSDATVQRIADRLQVEHVLNGVLQLPLRQRPPPPISPRFALRERHI